MKVIDFDGAPVVPGRNVTIRLFSILTGRTEKSVRRKIEEGKWVEGREYHRDPDGSVVVDRQGVERWETGSR